MNAQRRIFLLISLIAAAGIALLVFALLRDRKPAAISVPKMSASKQVLVANADIPAGAQVTPAMVTWQAWPDDRLVKGFILRTGPQAENQHISGTVTRANILKGMPVTDAMLIKTEQSGYLAAMLQDGMRAIAIPVSMDRAVAGFIRPGNHVDILFAMAGSGQPQIRVLLSDVRVLAIDQTAEVKPDTPQAVKNLHNVTLEVTPEEAEKLTRAHMTGNLTLTLRPLPRNDSTGPIRIIRGGPAPDLREP